MRIPLSRRKKERILDEAGELAPDPYEVAYPDWYLQHWHFLPEGYLSRRSAAVYEALIPRLYNVASEARVIRALVSAVQSRGATDILELGCGPGHTAQALAQAMPGALIVGMDLSPFQLERAKSLTGDERTVTLVHGDATDIPAPGRSFDAVVAVHVLGHLPARVARRAKAEAVRVLRPGGRLVTVDHRWHPRRAVEGLRLETRQRLLGGLIELDVLRRDGAQRGPVIPAPIFTAPLPRRAHKEVR